MSELVDGADTSAPGDVELGPGTVFVGVGVAYTLLATSAYELFGALSIGVTFFPPAGLTFAAFLLLPRRRWPAVGAAVVVGEVLVDMLQGQGFWWSLGWAGANLSEPLVGATATRLAAGPLRLERRFAVSLLFGGLLVGPAVGASIGATVLRIADDMAWLEGFPDVWVGDALGVLVVAPAVLVLARPGSFVVNRTRPVDVLWVAALTAALCLVLVAADDASLGYAAVPLLAVPAARYSGRELAASGVVVASVLTFATARGEGPWATNGADGAQADLLQQQAFLLVALASAWLLKLEVLERLKALRSAHDAEVELQSAQGVAMTLQQAIMPGGIRPVEGARITGHYLPAAETMEVGGDWYDVIVDEGGRSATILVGDVVGHSLAAAAAMGKLAPAGRALAYAGHWPGALVSALDVMAANTEHALLTTLVCARVDLDTGTLCLTVAGHPPPLLRHPDGTTTWLDDSRGLPLGLPTQGARQDVSVPLPPGSAVLFYTDGLIEQRTTPLEARLEALAAAFRAADLRQDDLCTTVLDAMLDTHEQEDDIAMVCVARPAADEI